MLSDYFLDLWTSLEILLDFFRISSDRRDVSLENHENATWLLGKVAPRAGETLENTRSFFRVGGPKAHPRESQNLPKS